MKQKHPLHDPAQLLPSRKPASPNSPDNMAQGSSKPDPNSDFPHGWPKSTNNLNEE